MYTPAMQGLFGAMLGPGHPMVNPSPGGGGLAAAGYTGQAGGPLAWLMSHGGIAGAGPLTPMGQQAPSPLAALMNGPGIHGAGPMQNVPQMGGAPVNMQAMANPINANVNVQAPLPAIHPTFGQHIQALFQNNPGVMQGLMGLFQQQQPMAPMQAPPTGIVGQGAQPWNAMGHF